MNRYPNASSLSLVSISGGRSPELFKVVNPREIVDLSLTCEPIQACNAYLRASPRLRRYPLIVDLALDFIVRDAWDYFATYFFGLILRWLSNLVVSLPAPEGMLWEDPGFFVTYGVTSDFFFSGHMFTSLCLQSWLTSRGIVGWLILGLELVTIIITRSHYYMDIYAAVTTFYSLESLAYVS